MEGQLLAIIRQRGAGHPLGFADIDECGDALGLRAATVYALLDDLERHGQVDLSDAAFGMVRAMTGAGGKPAGN